MAALTLVAEGERVDETREERRGGDRRSAWSDPHFWVPIIIQAVMALVTLTTIVVTTRLSISGINEKIAELRGQVTTLQNLVQVTTEQKGDIQAIKDRVGKLENFESTQREAYNLNFTTRLARVEASAGIPPAELKK